MTTFARVLALAGIAVAVAACGQSREAGLSNTSPAAGTPAAVAAAPSPAGIMVDSRGMTVYTYDRDQPGRSACTGRCARDFRPVVAPPNAAYSQEWTTVRRSDGVEQWAYQGRALYTSVRDQQPGETNGDGMDNGRWHVVRR
jgi:predicted lipoprotein with Yx(FWY)xxD motif